MVSHDIFGFATDPLENFFANNLTRENSDKKKPIAYGLALSSTFLTGSALIGGAVVGGLVLASSPVTAPVAIALATTALGVTLVAGVAGYLIKNDENSDQNSGLSSSKNDLSTENSAEFQSPKSMIMEAALYPKSPPRIIGEDLIDSAFHRYVPKQINCSALIAQTKKEDEIRAIALESRFMIPSPQPKKQQLSKSESISSKSGSFDTSESGSIDSSKSCSVDPSQLSFTQKKQKFESRATLLKNTTKKKLPEKSQGRY